jgi:predicted metal-dependent phosphoesterase TrpH
MNFESLHNHTKDSDGAQTHLEVLAAAEKLGYSVVAFTDHDLVIRPDRLELLRAYKGPVKWISGIEISSGAPSEVVEGGTLHVLGLFVDPTNPELVRHSQELEQSRLVRMEHFVTQLQGLGFTITIEDCLAQADESPVGSPHIVNAIASHPENQAVMDKLLEQMRLAGETDPEVKKRYDYMIKEGERQYPYVLFMKHGSFIPMPKAPSFGTLLDFDKTVAIIRGAGGVAILAHWFFNRETVSKELLEHLVEQKRIDGLETEVVNMISKRDISRDKEFLQKLARTYDLVETIGSDGHDEKDMAEFARSSAAEESIGQTELLITHNKPSLEWSNLAS